MNAHRSVARRLGVALMIAMAATGFGAGGDARASRAVPALVAFPGAEGFGAGATGGRGGDVMIVDTLEPFGPGSLGDALAPEDCRPRTVVFAVSGVIEVPGPSYDLELTCGDLTLAGQTAPGAGITVHGRIDGYGAGGNLIIRHLRVRPPPITDDEGAVDDLGLRYDALQLSGNPNTILDHLSLSWGSDETLDMYEFSPDSTVQWSTIEQSNPQGTGEAHNDGMIAGPDSPRFTVHHVLMAHHEARCPAVASGPLEVINNVVYDCKDALVHHNPATGEFHIAGNTFLQGPSHDEFTPMYFDDEEPGGTTYWLSQNRIVAPGRFEGVVDDISSTALAEAAFSAGATASQIVLTPSDFTQESATYQPVTVEPPDAAFESVLAIAGAFPRDQITIETVDDVRTGGGDWSPDPPSDLLAGLTPGIAPADGDRDGMADDWETEHGLDPVDGDDYATAMGSGYTAIEEYVNGLADALVGGSPAVAPPPPPGATDEPPTSDAAAAAPSRDDTDPAAPATPSRASTVQENTSRGDGTTWLAIVALVASVTALVVAGLALRAANRLRQHAADVHPPPAAAAPLPPPAASRSDRP